MNSYIRYFGFTLLAAAALIALYIGLTVIQLVYSPDSVGVVQLSKDFLAAKFPLMATDIDGVKDHIQIDPSARLFMVFFVGAIALVALSSLMGALIRGGIALLKYSEGPEASDT